ncbi:hypothetical protein STEG23_011613, partial [Scotinomys teguina]
PLIMNAFGEEVSAEAVECVLSVDQVLVSYLVQRVGRAYRLWSSKMFYSKAQSKYREALDDISVQIIQRPPTQHLVTLDPIPAGSGQWQTFIKITSVSVHNVPAEAWKRALDSLELGLQSYLLWVLATKLRSSGRIPSLLDTAAHIQGSWALNLCSEFFTSTEGSNDRPVSTGTVSKHLLLCFQLLLQQLHFQLHSYNSDYMRASISFTPQLSLPSTFVSPPSITSPESDLRFVTSYVKHLRFVTSYVKDLRFVTSYVKHLRFVTSYVKHLRFVTSYDKHLRFVTSYVKHLCFVTSYVKHLRFVTSYVKHL